MLDRSKRLITIGEP